MRICLIFLLISCCIPIRSQDHCKYEAKKFKQYGETEVYEFGLTSEQGGLFPNAFTLNRNSLQIETDLALSPKTPDNESGAFTSVSQVRYGLTSKFEIRIRAQASAAFPNRT